MKNLLAVFIITCLISCRHSDPDGIAKGLQHHRWDVKGWLGAETLEFKPEENKGEWQASFLPNGRLIKSHIMNAPDTQFDAHGYEIAPGSLYVDSCYTYELHNDIIKITSHGHSPPDDLYFYRLNPEQDPNFRLIKVSEKDFDKSAKH